MKGSLAWGILARVKLLDNPARKAFLQILGDGLTVAQVRVRRGAEGFELCHAADADAPSASLRLVPVADLRGLAQTTAAGAFRPLHAAPDLACGWRCVAADEAALEIALQHLYPGFLPDWWAAQQAAPPITHFREFAARQSGMYRCTAALEDAAAARVAAVCCAADFCLKRRRWSVPGLPPDGAEAKSLIPCLEPCAVLLEFARKVARLEGEPRLALDLGISDLDTIQAALEFCAGAGQPIRAADFNDPANPRRLRLVREKLRRQATPEAER